MAYAQGSVVLVPGIYKNSPRPVLIVSNKNRPYHGKQYTVAIISSKQRPQAVELTAGTLTEGQLKKYPSYVNAWSLHEFEHSDILSRVAQVSKSIQQDVADAIYDIVAPS